MTRLLHIIGTPISATAEKLAFVDFAAQTVKKAGFIHIYSSRKSEACYYRLGDRAGALRIAAHRYGPRSEGSYLDFPVWSCLTFGDVRIKSAEAILSAIEHAVGRYVMFPHTKITTARRDMTPIAHLLDSEQRERRP